MNSPRSLTRLCPTVYIALLQLFAGRGLLVAKVHPLLRQQAFLAIHVEMPDDDGTMTMLATPAEFHGTPSAPRFRAPRLGEHTDAVLGELKRADF